MCRFVARNETRLLQARDRSAPPVLLGPAREVFVEQAVHEQAAGAAAAQLHRAAHIHLEQPAVPVRHTGEPVVDAGKFGRGVGQALGVGESRRTGAHVHGPARQVAQRFRAVEGRAVHVREEGKHVVLRFRGVEVDPRAFLKSIQHVAGEAIVALEPADVPARRAGVARQHSEVHRQVGIEAEVRQTLPEALPAADGRHDVEQRVVLGDREVMHHAVVAP